jgi:hypothetical protein
MVAAVETKLLVILEQCWAMTASDDDGRLDLTLIQGQQEANEDPKGRRLVGCLASSLSEYRLATNLQLPPPQPLLFTRTSQPPARSIEPSLGRRGPLDERENETTEAKCRIGAGRCRYWRPSRHPAVPLAAHFIILPMKSEKQTHETVLRVTRQLGGSSAAPKKQKRRDWEAAARVWKVYVG